MWVMTSPDGRGYYLPALRASETHSVNALTDGNLTDLRRSLSGSFRDISLSSPY
ncbi:MAG: hypothetical protein ACRD9R_20550 [Pyrinomonadaceae bacterium]